VESLVSYLKNKKIKIVDYNSYKGDVVGEDFVIECKNGDSLNTSGCDRLLGQMQRYMQNSCICRGVILVFGDIRADLYSRLKRFQPENHLQVYEVKVLGTIRNS
jgi:hypothetical protein